MAKPYPAVEIYAAQQHLALGKTVSKL